MSPGPDERRASEGAEAIPDAVASLWPRFEAGMYQRLGALEEAAVAVIEGELPAELRSRAEREAHKLVGALGTFGIPEGSRLARELEELLAGSEPLDGETALTLSSLTVALRRAIEGGPAVPRPSGGTDAADAPVGGPASRLLIIEDDPEYGERLVLEATARGLEAVVVGGPAAARTAWSARRPDVVLLDLEIGADRSEGLSLLRELTGADPPIPVVVLTGHGDFADRVEVARLGGRGFLVKPLAPPMVLEAVRNQLREVDAEGPMVLAVDDDPVILEIVEQLLRPDGLRVLRLDDPLSFWDTLETVSPDLVVMDLDMPGLNGVELCRMLRGDPRWSSLPVLFLTGHGAPEEVERIFEAGADDYVAKPIVGPELRTRIRNRLERVALHRRLAEVDELTGVANRGASQREIERLLRLAGRHGQPLAFVALDLDHFKRLNDTHGHAAGDRVLRRVGEVLRRAFRGDDVVARWGGEEFVVAMLGMDRQQGVERTADVLEQVRALDLRRGGEGPERVTFSAGVAEYPEDGSGMDALYRAADRALYRAKETGRDRVVPVGWLPQGAERPEKVDVAVVEDDAVIAELLLHALRTRGYRTRWLADGYAALESLGGDEPTVRARVVVLDIGLPGLDGLTLLRRLAEEGLTRHTRFLMLTARSAESEVLEALDLGAWDHVAKPFSVPVLMHRVRRALEGGDPHRTP